MSVKLIDFLGAGGFPGGLPVMSMSAVCELPRLTLLRSGEHTPNKGRLEERRGRGAALHQGRVSVRTDNDRGEMITGLSVRHLNKHLAVYFHL